MKIKKEAQDIWTEKSKERRKNKSKWKKSLI